MMMDGGGRYYYLEPTQHRNLVQDTVEQTEFPTTVYLQF